MTKKNQILSSDLIGKDNEKASSGMMSKAIDFVLAYSLDNNVKDKPDKNEDINKARKSLKSYYRYYFLKNLKRAGMVLEKVKDDKIMYVLVHTPFSKLLEIAEKTNQKLPIEINELRVSSSDKRSCHSFTKYFELPGELGEDQSTKYFTASYTSTLHKKFERFFDFNDLQKTIPEKDRSLLAYEVLSRIKYSKLINDFSEVFTNPDGDNKIGIDRLVANQTFLAAFPLHDPLNDAGEVILDDSLNLRQKLRKYWATPKMLFKYQPLHMVRDYFGEKLAFYYAWLGFYTGWLTIPSIFGFFVFLYGCITLAFDPPTNEICDKKSLGNLTMCPLCDDDFCEVWKLHESCLYSQFTYMIDNPTTIIFSVIMAIWTVIFLDFWKRKQSRLQFDWDTNDFEKNVELIRPEFENKVKKKRKNPITGIEEPYVPLFEEIFNFSISYAVVILMIFLVVAFLFGVIVYRIIIKALLYQYDDIKNMSSTFVSITAACINLIIIIILSKFYEWIAVKLTDFEYHRTDTQYESSLTIKIYLFQFVNFYGSIFYVAFFKGRSFSNKIGRFELLEECDPAGCLIDLCIQLGIIMVGKQVLNNIQEIVIPYMQNKFTVLRKSSLNSTQWKKDFYLINWTNLTLFDEYLEMVIQFGFMTLFVVAFPLGPLFALINNIMEIRIDAFKFLTQFRRPIPKRAQDIGIWGSILSAVSKIGVITNGFIIAFTSDFIPRMVYQYGYNNGSLKGYIKHSLSMKLLRNGDTCYYKDFRHPPDSPNSYEFTQTYYVVLAARLAFVVVFEHFVFFLVSIMHLLIPDVPKEIQDQTERENLITQRALWEVKTDTVARALSNPELRKIEVNDNINDENENENDDNEIDETIERSSHRGLFGRLNLLASNELIHQDNNYDDNQDIITNSQTDRV